MKVRRTAGRALGKTVQDAASRLAMPFTIGPTIGLGRLAIPRFALAMPQCGTAPTPGLGCGADTGTMAITNVSRLTLLPDGSMLEHDHAASGPQKSPKSPFSPFGPPNYPKSPFGSLLVPKVPKVTL